MIRRVVKFSLILLILFLLGCELIKPEEELKIGIPGDVKITQIDGETLKVSWSSVSKATSYEVAIKEEGEDWTFENTKETSLNFDSLVPGKYEAKVKAIINETKGDFSEVARFTLVEESRVGIPGNVKITKIDDESLKVTWDAVSKATGYEVAFAKEGEIWSFASASSTSYTYNSLTPGTYQVKVRAAINSYNGDFSTVTNFNLTVDTSSNSGIFSSGDVNITGASGKLISSTIDVTGINLVNEVVVRINVDHDLLDFCDVSLKSPDGTWIYLTEGSNAGAGKDYINTVFDDKAETSILDPANKAPYTGRFKPESNLKPMSTFKGKKADGTWTLSVYDEGSDYSFAIKSWDIAFNGKGFSMEGADDVIKLTLDQWSAEEIEAGVDSVWFSADVTPGKEYVFTMDEGESGEGTGNYTLNTKANIFKEDKKTKIVNTSDIWDSYSYPTKFTVPAGVNKILIEVDAATTGQLGTFALKVTEQEPAQVVSGIDLIVTVDSVVIDGSNTKLTYTVKNQGNTNISGSTYFTVKLIPHSDETPTSDSSGRITATFSAGNSSRDSNLDAGESNTQTSTFTTESSYSGTYLGGTAYAVVNVYSDSNFTEADSSNNVSSSFDWGNPAGDFTNSTISTIGEEDYYSFSVVSGEKYYIQGSRNDEDSHADINVELLKTDETSIESKDISNLTTLSWTADTTGTVYLKAFADNYSDRYKTGTYSIRAFSVSGEAALTAIDDPFNTSTPASTDATLSSLTLSNGSISFNSSTEDYTVDVANSVDSITVTPTVNDSGATVTVEGTSVTSGSSSSAISLTVGVAQEINIVVTAEDGTTSKEYTVKVTREAPAISGIDLVVTVDSVVIDGSQTKFTYTVKNQGNTDISGSTYFTVKLIPHSDETPTSDSSGRITATFSAGNSSRDSNLDAGESNTQTSTFTTESSYSGTYLGGTAYALVNVYSDSNFTEADSTNNVSSSLNWGNPAGDFTNSSISTIGEEDYYSFSVVSGEKYYIQGSRNDEDSHADINVELLKTDETSIESKDISNLTTLSWTADSTGTVYLKAFADNYSDRYKTGTYSIRVFSVSGEATLTAIDDPFTSPASTDATLSSLTLSNGSISFSSSTENYTVEVANSVDSITVTPTVNYSGATVTVEGSSVTSGSSSSAISLTAGVAEEINIVVTAEDGTTSKEYTVSVTRAADVTTPGLTEGTLTAAEEKWYAFDVTSGFEYTITTEDDYTDDAYTADVVTDVIKYTEIVNFIVEEADYYGDSNKDTFVASDSGTIYIRIAGYYSHSAGTYAVNVKDSSGSTITLTETGKKQSKGLEGSITSGGETWFTVPGYANTSTYISWKDDTSEYANIKVSAYPNYSGINAYFEDVNIADGYPETVTPISDGTIYIKVTGYDSTEAGDFLIKARNIDNEYLVITELE